MRRSINLASAEYRVLSLAAKAAGRSLDDFLVYQALSAAEELLKGRDAVRAALMAGERSGPAKPFDFGEMMADADSEHAAERRRRREYFDKTAPGLKGVLLRSGYAGDEDDDDEFDRALREIRGLPTEANAPSPGADDKPARRQAPSGDIFDADSWPRRVAPPKRRPARRRRRRPSFPTES